MSSRRGRIFGGILLLYLAGIGFLLYRVQDDLGPRYRESAEESMVDTAQLVATWLEQDGAAGPPDVRPLPALLQSLQARDIEARIFGLVKTRVELQLSVTDAAGRVLYDSTGVPAGTDHAHWRDVHLTLRGAYGARTTQQRPGDPASAVMWVAAPVRGPDGIRGVVSIGKPVTSLAPFVAAARDRTLAVGALSAGAVLLLAVILSAWLVRPFGILTDYARYVRAQPRLHFGRLARRAWDSLWLAYQEMRDALAGRDYVADYVQTLTHELKSPLSAIRGASELLQEPGMPQAQRTRFLDNIQRETGRIQELVDRMMELTALESRRALEHVAPVALSPLLQEVAAAATPTAAARAVALAVEATAPVQVEGDAFLLRRALSNLLANAIDFSPASGTVRLRLVAGARAVAIEVRDQGPGIPGFARDQLFEKFYSLPRPGGGRKSTGLGLPFVREIAALHHGRITLDNAEGGGAIARLTLPRSDRG